MTAKTRTREALISKGAELIHAGGFHATGLSEILEQSGVPKGSFYFYFKSKEDFGLAIIDHFASLIDGFFVRFLLDASLPPLLRFERFFDFYEKMFTRTGCHMGCPIGNLSLELSDSSERLRARLDRAVQTLLSRIEVCLDEAKTLGVTAPDLDPAETARFFFQAIQGATLHMKVVKNLEPLKICRRQMLSYLNRTGAIH